MLFKEKSFLIFIFVMACLIRLSYSFYERIVPFGDAGNYDKIAFNLKEGRGYTKLEKGLPAEDYSAVGYPPLYPFFLAAIYKLVGYSYPAVWGSQAIIGATTCILIYLLAKTAFNQTTAVFSAIISTFYFELVLYTGMLLTETLYIFLVLVTFIYLFKAFEQKNNIGFLLAGIFSGLSALTRPIILIFLAFLIIWGLKGDRYRKGALFFILCLFLVILPWIARNSLVYHQFIPITAGGDNFWIGNNPKANGECFFTDEMLKDNLSHLELNYEGYKRGLIFIAWHPARFLLLSLKKISLFWSLLRIEGWWPHMQGLDRLMSIEFSFFSAAFILTFGILGIVFSFKEKNIHRFWLRNFVFLCPLSLIPFFVEARYRIPIYPFMIIFTGYALTLLPDIKKGIKLKEKKIIMPLRISLILITLLLLNTIYDSMVNGGEIISRINSLFGR